MAETGLLSGAIPPAERTLPRLLLRQALRFGTRPLLRCGQTVLSFAEAPVLAARAAARLAAAGARPGQPVALLCGNRPEFLSVFLGCAWLGAPCVPVNTAVRAPQLDYLLRDSGARLLLVEAALCDALRGPDGQPLEIEAAQRPIVIDDAWWPAAAPDGRSAGDDADPHPSMPGDTLAILYTSGTTGPAKGVCCPHAQYFWWGLRTAQMLGLTQGEVLHTALPLFHINALNTFAQALLTGGTQVLEARFSVSRFWTALAASGATATYLLGAMVPMLLSRAAGPHERAHRVRVALAPGVPDALHAPFSVRTGIELLDGYGSTETSFVIGARGAARRPGTIGWLCDGFQARIADEQDNELPAGEAGELLLRADDPFAFATGYHGRPEHTVQAWRNLWFHTGDRLVREPDGAFRFVDRIKDSIRRRGENISSFEIEQVLAAHPAIASAVAYPVRSELAEDEVMVAVVLRAGCSLAPAALLDFCRPRLPSFALPRFVEFLDDLPRTENGKVQKFVLRERGPGPAAWDRQAAR